MRDGPEPGRRGEVETNSRLGPRETENTRTVLATITRYARERGPH